MRRFTLPLIAMLTLMASEAGAWSNHTFASYRAFEALTELKQAAPVRVEPLEAFLKDQEQAIESLLASQEVWASSQLDVYPARPAALAFKANAARNDDARRLAFLTALRVAPNSKFALYVQPDPWGPPPEASTLLPHAAVNTLPEQANSTYRFVGLAVGATVSPLNVLASATDEPDYGLDINLWQDSPSDWGKVYGFGALPFGNPALYYSTQAPFHMGFFHEDKAIYLAAAFIKKTFPLWRVQQYTGLATLAFRSGHPYWGWRFTGMALHYLQDLTQPYHASMSPGNGTAKLIGINLLAIAGMPRLLDEMIVLLSNRHLALEKYQNQLLYNSARARQGTAMDQALRQTDRDASYPAWTDLYTRDVVSRQSHAVGPQLTDVLLATLPAGYVSDPNFDFGVKEAGIDLAGELSRQGSSTSAQRAKLDAMVAELLGNFGAHSRNLVRGVLKSAGPLPK